MEYIIGLATQTRSFLLSLGLGALVGAVYDLIRIIRLVFTKSKQLSLIISDILFVLFGAVMTFLFFLTVSDGEIRLYLLFGESLGFSVYYFSFGVIAVRFSYKTALKVKKVTKKIMLFIFAPIIKFSRFFFEKMSIFLKFLQKMSKKSSKNAKILLQKDKVLLYNLTDRMHKFRKNSVTNESDRNYGEQNKEKTRHKKA